MRIAVIAHSLYPIKEPFEGGLEMVTYLLCHSLLQRGHSVTLFGHADSNKRFNVHSLAPVADLSKRILAEFTNVGENATSLKEMAGYARTMNEIAVGHFDVVHNHSMHYLPILMGNSLGIPMITSIHTPTFPYLKLGTIGVRDNCRQTFTMVSKSLARTWADLVPKAEIVYNGIDLSKWSFTALPKGDYLFWYGRICPEKGTHMAIRAALQVGKPIVLAGPISNQEYYDQEVVSLLKNPLVKYIGHCAQSELAPFLSNALAMLFTSTWEEPYGLTIAESLACGTPVIAFDSGAAKEIITKKTGYIVPNSNVDATVKAIVKIDQLSRFACRERAENFCSHKVMVDRYISLYKRLQLSEERNLQVV